MRGIRRTVTFHGVDHSGDLVRTERPVQVKAGSTAEDCHRPSYRFTTSISLYFDILSDYAASGKTRWDTTALVTDSFQPTTSEIIQEPYSILYGNNRV
jgi:hypothetical protein